MELVVFSGLQAPGKSSFYRERFAATHTLVSKDLLRNSKQRDLRHQELIAAELEAGRSVVVDNTNPAPHLRAALVSIGHRFGAVVVGYSFVSTVADAIRRNEAREGKARIPKVGIFTTAKKLVPMTFDEGFDEIFVVRLTDAGFEVERLERRQ
jgi:predicted kinase